MTSIVSRNPREKSQCHLLHVLPYFRPALGFGGPVITTDLVTKAFSAKGYNVTIWTTDIGHLDGSRLTPLTEWSEGRSIKRYPYASKLIYQKSGALLAPRMMLDALTLLKPPSLVHLHDFRSFQALAAYTLCRRARVPMILQPHGTLKSVGGRESLKAGYDMLVGTRLARDAARILVLSKSEADECVPFGIDEEKVVTVANGVRLPSQEALRAKGVFRDQFNIDSDAFLVLYMGRIRETKGVMILLDAFEELSRSHNNAVLVLCGGDDGAEKKVRQRAREKKLRVLITGFVTGPLKEAAFVDSDAFCLPSFFETQSVALLEAGSYGLPIVACPHNVPEEFITDKAGLFVPLDGSRLAQALEYFADSEDDRRRFGQRARATVEQHFGLERLIESLECVYEDVLNHG